MRLTVDLQYTALPGHSLLCPQFEQVPWYHSKKWRSGLLTQRSHCTDPCSQDLPTSIGDSPKKRRSKNKLLMSQKTRRQVSQLTIHPAGESRSHTVCTTLESYRCKEVSEVKLKNTNYWWLEARTDNRKVNLQGGLMMFKISGLK